MKKTRISCCGDSITFGLMATSQDKSYPSVLQNLLGESYEVLNFGHSGATVIDDYDEVPDRYLPYDKTDAYKESLKSDPDIVILMLGMNDANPTHCFNEQNGGGLSDYYKNYYEEVLVNLIKTYQNLPTNPKVYLGRTTHMMRTVENGHEEHYVKYFNENLSKILVLQQNIAEKMGVPFIDTRAGMEDESNYRDGVHMTDAGYEKLANVFFKALNQGE